MTTDDDTPDTVSVTGTSLTPDGEVTMLEGATGARIPTGEHRRSGAMPTSEDPGTPQRMAVMVAIVAAVVLAFVVVVVLLVSNA